MIIEKKQKLRMNNYYVVALCRFGCFSALAPTPGGATALERAPWTAPEDWD